MNEDTGTVLVTLGRIEERLSAMSEKETKTGERLDRLEAGLQDVKLELAKNVRPKAPWWAVVGAVVGMTSAAAALIGGFVLLSNVINALENAPL